MGIIKNNKNYGIETKITSAPPQVQYDQLIFTTVNPETATLNINLGDRYIKDCSYSLDEGATWTALPADADGYTTTSQSINFTDKLYVRWSKLYIKVSNAQSLFYSSKPHNVSGDLYNFSSYNYHRLFYLNNSLKDASGLIFHSDTINSYCCQDMFYGCTSLTTAPALPATKLSQNCYQQMFINCYNLTTAPALPATTLFSSCYQGMFQNCTSLTTAPALSATTLTTSCYQYMFSGCTALTSAPTLSATTLASSCCLQMFRNCMSLTTAPVLHATNLVATCYKEMFTGCTNLNSVTTYANTLANTSAIQNWLNNVSATGDFFNLGTYSYPSGASGIPSGWTEHTSL